MKPLHVALCLIAFALPSRAEVLKIAGSRVLGPVAAEATKILRDERGLDIVLSADIGTDSGVAALAEHQVQIALCARHLTGEERALAPEVVFNEIPIGEHAIALAVSRDVWNGGIRVVTRTQIRDVYEGRVTNWKKLDGPDEKILFFNRDERRGAWETFAGWLYGEARKAPGVNFDVVDNDDEAREAVESKRGAISQLSVLLTDRKSVFPLAIKSDAGKIIEPSLKNIASHEYPLSHPLLLVVDNSPTRAVKVFVDFLLSLRGQEILKKHGFIPVADLEKAKQP